MTCFQCNGTGCYGPDQGDMCDRCNGSGEEEDDIWEAVMHYQKDHPEPNYTTRERLLKAGLPEDKVAFVERLIDEFSIAMHLPKDTVVNALINALR